MLSRKILLTDNYLCDINISINNIVESQQRNSDYMAATH